MGIVSMTLFDTLSFLIITVIVNTNDPYSYIMDHFPIRMSGAIISKLLFFIFIELYKRFKGRDYENEHKEITPEIVVSVAFATVFVILLVYNLMGISRNTEAIVQLNIYIVVLVMVVLSGGFFVRNRREKETMRKKTELILNENKMINAHYMEDVSLYEKMRENRHDVKHHKEYLRYLEKEQKYEEMIQYIGQILSGGMKNE
jgi:purine-cytosine permease-like protein